jgi:cation diffusion facilitator CzcD-associated flavoprotein CzcO
MESGGVVVLGAGPGGLAAGASLKRAGVPAVLLDRADRVGAAWRTRYDRLRLNTCRWISRLPGGHYARGTPLFPTRDEVVAHLEEYAARHELDIRFGVEVARVDRADPGWTLSTSAGEMSAEHVVVATGHEHTPVVPHWPGRETFGGRLLHVAEYRNADPFRGQQVLVVGPGCSGLEVAYELAEQGAARVWLSVRTPPSFLLRQQGGLPGDFPAMMMMKLPIRVADAQVRLVGRLTFGDLGEYGLPQPDVGAMTRLKGEGKAPAIVDKEMVRAIKDGRIEVVPGVEAFDERGSHVEPDAVIAATGYSTGLEPLVGHLGVLDEHGVPRVRRGEEAAPGLRFVGYVPQPGQIRAMGIEARRAARGIARARALTAA